MNWLEMNIWHLSRVLFFLALVAFGIKGLVEKKPLIYSSRGFFNLLVLLGFGPLLFRALCELMDGQHWQQSVLEVIIGLGIIFLFLLLNRGIRGYSFLGTTNESLRGAILAALSARSLAYEEMPTKFYLKNEKVEVAFRNSWLSGELSITKEHEETLRAIVTEMKKYFRENKVSVNLSLFAALLVIGILALIRAIYRWKFGYGYYF